MLKWLRRRRTDALLFGQLTNLVSGDELSRGLIDVDMSPILVLRRVQRNLCLYFMQLNAEKGISVVEQEHADVPDDSVR